MWVGFAWHPSMGVLHCICLCLDWIWWYLESVSGYQLCCFHLILQELYLLPITSWVFRLDCCLLMVLYLQFDTLCWTFYLLLCWVLVLKGAIQIYSHQTFFSWFLGFLVWIGLSGHFLWWCLCCDWFSLLQNQQHWGP